MEDEKRTSSEEEDKDVNAHLLDKPVGDRPTADAAAEEPEVEGHSLLDKPVSD